MRQNEFSSETEIRAENNAMEGQPDTVVSEQSSSGNTVCEDKQIPVQQILTGVTSTENTGLQVYADKDGLPVMYDSAAPKQKKQTKADDISVLWHELLSPLTIIKAHTSALLKFNGDIEEEEKLHYIRCIDAANNKAIKVLENLRDIYYLEEDKDVSTRSVCMVGLIKNVIQEVQEQTGSHVIKLHPHPRLPKVQVEPEKIKMVLDNIIGNAIKYSQSGDDIEVKMQLIRNGQELSSSFHSVTDVKVPCLVVSVSDEGMGIPEEELDKIFTRFYRVKNRLTKGIPGTGLGLYISRKIVEAHGGSIWASNKYHKGSVFNFSLPLS